MPRLSPEAARIADRLTALKPYQPGRPIEDVRREYGIVGEIVKLASNENPLGVSPAALVALAEVLPRLALYPDGGCHDLRLAVAAHLDVSPDMLVFGNGSDEIIHLLGLTFLEPGDELVIGDPTFVLYEAAATLAGATVVKVPLTRPGLVHDVDVMTAAVTEKTRLVIIANPHNPTGTIVENTAALYRLMERLPPRALLVLDEAYAEYVYHRPGFPKALDFVKAGAPVLGLRTFSKMYGLAGLRVGYGVADAGLIAAMNQARSPFNVNLAAQVAATAAINDYAFVEKSRAVNETGLAQFYAAFEAMGLPYIPSFANFVLVDTKQPCRDVFHALLKRGVIVRTGDVFGLPTFLRVTVGTPAQNERFLEALREVLGTGATPAQLQ
ncbi:MAG: histidinol-phosphate transaminase [Armatimonadetes bacterium]|nr:histidinol-phosphate transaminase [Armatimonadota bacterium]